MSPTPVVVFATFRPEPGKHETLLSLLEGMVVHTRAEPGNERYDLYVAGAGDDRTFHLFERYTSSDALEAHRQADYYKAYRAELPDLLKEPVEVLVLTALDAQPEG